MVAGDFNSRVVVENDYVEYDSFISELDCDDYSLDSHLDRASQDKISNARENKLLDLCKSSGLKLVNGRVVLMKI